MSDKANQNEKVAPLDNHATSSFRGNGYEYKLIALDSIEPDPNQPRKDFSGLKGLINSIEHEGLIYPITIAPQPDNPDKYIIIDGERRFRAYKELNNRAIENQEIPSKYETISARILPSFESRIGILLNLMNKGYNSLEIAESLDLLLKEITSQGKSFTKKDLADYLGKSPANISEYFSLLKLPSAIKEQERKYPCVPFNKLKQLAASKNEDSEKIEEYQKLRHKYEENEKEEKNGKKKDIQEGTPANSPFKGAYRSYNALTKKLQGTSEALGNFEIKNIKENDRKTLAVNLDKIIDEAQKLKKSLEEARKQDLV